MAIVILKGIDKVYTKGREPVEVLEGIALGLDEGDFVALMGPSGSGKTTLLNLIGGIDQPTRGSVVVGGQQLVGLSSNKLAKWRSENIGFIFQSYNLLPVMSALMNVALPTIFAGMSTSDGEKRAMECLDIVGLKDRAHHLPSELSGGQQQRVAIARAFVNQPRIILADEPTGNLDSNTGQSIIDFMKTMQDEMGSTIIAVTHDDKMLSACDRMAWIRDGALERVANRADIDIRMGSIKEH